MAPDFATDAFLTDARKRMVDSQVRPNKVSDPRILDAMRHLPRERYLPASLIALAYSDQNIDLGHGRVMLQPMVLARMVQALVPLRGERALVVGTGYAAALLAALGCEVTVLEDQAEPRHGFQAPVVNRVSGPLAAGWPEGAPYHVILVEGAVPSVPPSLAGQLHTGEGRLVAILGEPGRTSHAIHAEAVPGGVSQRALFDCQCPVIPGFAAAPVFEF